MIHSIKPVAEPAQDDTGASTKCAKNKLNKALSVFLSTTFLTACLLTGVTIYCYRAFDWKELAAQDSSPWIVNKAAIAPNYIYNQQNRDIVLTGSSLIMAPSESLSDLEGPAIGRVGAETSAPLGQIYREGLRQTTGKTYTIKVLGIPGALTSDQKIIATHLIKNHKVPKLLVFAYAPRDFMSNDIGDDIEFTPTARVFYFASLNRSILPASFNLPELKSCLEAHRSYIDAVRRVYLRACKEKACEISGHPANLFQASVPTKQKDLPPPPVTPRTDGKLITAAPPRDDKATEQDHQKALDLCLSLYRARYLPINQNKIKTQMEQLDLMLAACRKQNLPVMLVGMPLSAKNIEILSENQRVKMADQIKSIASRYGASVVDFNDLPDKQKYQQDEFIDSVHLNARGARRFVDMLSERIYQSDAYKQAFGKAP